MPSGPFLTRPSVRQLAGLATLIVIGVIVWASLASNGALPSVPGTDKLKHFAAYMGLAVPMLVWFGARRVVAVFAIVLALGAGLEIAQGLGGAGRTASLLDMVANVAGATFGLILSYVALGIDRVRAKGA